ncbi:hypothetical protein BU23DRAFT_560333 [Bimuria novae-zelandiae CBS 107.79]|uniref:Uncharacterized protein n=1 Tax=Bimuria novae-zelandiae CBS 107.79 TaxID=1447943 RepID=A0A6A5UQU1_9PLEO|nr:hypothetical protein BU23DRAFT_560333 [Bimuria novae-zelandiae CBS 107.79]
MSSPTCKSVKLRSIAALSVLCLFSLVQPVSGDLLCELESYGAEFLHGEHGAGNAEDNGEDGKNGANDHGRSPCGRFIAGIVRG